MSVNRKHIDPAETMGKYCISENIQIIYEKQLARMEQKRQEQYVEDHKDDDKREEIMKIVDVLENDTLNIDSVDTKITFRDIIPCLDNKVVSDKQLLLISSMVLKDRSRGYIEYVQETDESIITDYIPMKYLKKLEYIVTINGDVTTTFTIEIEYKLKDNAPTEAELIFAPYLPVDCTETSKDDGEVLKRRCWIRGSKNKKYLCHENN